MYWLQVFLNESGTEVDIELDQWRISNRLEAVDFTRFDDENVAGPTLERVAIDGPHAMAFADELDFIIRMPEVPVPRRAFPGIGTPKHRRRPDRLQQTGANYR